MTFPFNPPEKRGRKPGPVRTASKVLQKLYEITIAHDMSYRALGRKAGMAPNGLSRWAGGLGSPSIYKTECWAEALGLKLEVLTPKEKAFLERFRNGSL